MNHLWIFDKVSPNPFYVSLFRACPRPCPPADPVADYHSGTHKYQCNRSLIRGRTVLDDNRARMESHTVQNSIYIKALAFKVWSS